MKAIAHKLHIIKATARKEAVDNNCQCWHPRKGYPATTKLRAITRQSALSKRAILLNVVPLGGARKGRGGGEVRLFFADN
jgi:hypothetical protein